MASFTARCGNCGGFMVVQNRSADLPASPSAAETPPQKKWWQFWK